MRLLVLTVVSLLTFTGFVSEKGTNLKYLGSAADKKSNALYYTEEHEEVSRNGIHSATYIQYKNSKGEVIVSKFIDYTKSYTAPAYKQEDKRSGHLESVEYVGNQLKVSYRKNSQTPIETETLDVPSDAVIDGGFNYLVKNRWEDLVSGQAVTFNFIVPSERDYFSFRVKKIKEEKLNAVTHVVLKMESDNFFIRSLMDPIILTYNADTHRLIKYEGVSNINDAEGNRYVVRITYPTVGP